MNSSYTLAMEHFLTIVEIHGHQSDTMPAQDEIPFGSESFACLPNLDSQDLEEHAGRMEIRIQESCLDRTRDPLIRRTSLQRQSDSGQGRDASQPMQRSRSSRASSSSRPELPLLEATQRGSPF